jgi:imidazoleglycerol phosphate synthase glutamine amidotransferase subunit HisH
VPQFGWNRVEAEGDGWLESGWAYFANSYRVEAAPEGWEVATAQHGGPFVAAMRRGSVVTCQFHPELSGAWGQALIGSWLASERMVSSC